MEAFALMMKKIPKKKARFRGLIFYLRVISYRSP